ncbi:hypothetical protein QE152_g13980 [Popillia japonica]|uniref:Uncharacterized protein n=1 Tax=Popillia japonica TaxID=7064 RepID=A0AAW1LBF3_POPJA
MAKRHKFNTRIQRPGENFDTFLGELKKLAANCEFAQMKDELIKMKDELIKDRIVCGVLEAKIKDRLLREKDLDLTKAMEICRAAEQTEHQVRQLMEKTKTLEINEIKSKQPKQTFNKRFEHRRYS